MDTTDFSKSKSGFLVKTDDIPSWDGRSCFFQEIFR